MERKQTILTRKEFDRRFREDPSLREDTAGFSTISFYHIRKGVTPKGISVPLFSNHYGGCINCDLNPEVYRAVFGEEPVGWTGETDFEHLLLQNRDFGITGAIKEYFLTKSDLTDKDQTFDDVRQILELGINPLRKLLFASLPILRRRDSYIQGYFRDPDFYEAFHRLFPSNTDLIKAMLTLRNRKGVQVFYRNKQQFTQFLSVHGAQSDDDCAATLFTPIPPNLVSFVVPLGKYEEKALIGNK